MKFPFCPRTLKVGALENGSIDSPDFLHSWAPGGDLTFDVGHHPRKTSVHVPSARAFSRAKSMGIFRKNGNVKFSQN